MTEQFFFIKELDSKQAWENRSPSSIFSSHGIRDMSEDPLLPLRQCVYYTDYGILMPVAFLLCMEKQLRIDFEKKTGIKVNKQMCLYALNKFYSIDRLGLEYGETSYMNQSLDLNIYSLQVLIAWKSKSGRIYQLTDDDIDCDDIEIWFHKINVAEVYETLYPKMEMPFKLKGLTYELQVVRMDVNQTLQLHFKEGMEEDVEGIVKKIDTHIANLNSKSEKNDRKDGVVHNWDTRTITPLQVEYEIDMGSAGVKFIKGLLKFLSGFNSIEKVVME